MLGVREIDKRSYFGIEKPLQHLGGWAEEGNRTVGHALGFGFAGFLEGDDYCLFPDRGYFGVPIGEIVDLAEVLQAEGTKMAEVEDGEVVWAGSCGVAAVFDGLSD